MKSLQFTHQVLNILISPFQRSNLLFSILKPRSFRFLMLTGSRFLSLVPELLFLVCSVFLEISIYQIIQLIFCISHVVQQIPSDLP